MIRASRDESDTRAPAAGWWEFANCAGLDPSVFYADGYHAREQVRAAQRICGNCLVRAECGDYAIRTGERWGVWGGMSQRELRQRRRRFTSGAKTGTRAAA